jgi:hypothetical protein
VCFHPSHCRLFHRWLSSDSRWIQGGEKLGHHVRSFPGRHRGRWNWVPENDGRQYKARGERDSLNVRLTGSESRLTHLSNASSLRLPRQKRPLLDLFDFHHVSCIGVFAPFFSPVVQPCIISTLSLLLPVFGSGYTSNRHGEMFHVIHIFFSPRFRDASLFHSEQYRKASFPNNPRMVGTRMGETCQAADRGQRNVDVGSSHGSFL